MFEIVSRTMVSIVSLSNSEVRRRFKRRAADAADHCGAIAAGKRIIDLAGAIRAVERIWLLPSVGLLCHVHRLDWRKRLRVT
jgi:hypothetical protein